MIAALYLRVSTLEQTTDNQELELVEYCKRNNIQISKIYKDAGVSGSKTSRPELNNMLTDMRLGKFDAIIVWKFDRLGRSTKHLTDIISELDKKNIRLIAISQNIDTSTVMGKFFFTIISAIAELELEMIRERVNLGLKRAKAQGKKLGRPKGSKDKKVRRKSGYYMRYAG